jgi:uncharacterized coiled-coil protein SlyX
VRSLKSVAITMATFTSFAACNDGPVPPEDSPTNRHTSTNPEANDGVKTKFELRLRAEINIRKVSKSAQQQGAITVRSAVRAMIEALIKTEADTIIKSKDGNQSFQTMDDFPEDKDKFALFFPSTKNPQHQGPSTTVIEMHLICAQNLASLKKPSTAFFKHLLEKRIWLCHHKFNTLNVQSLGFFTERSTEFAWKSSFADEIRRKLQACIEEDLAASSPDNVVDTQQAEAPPEFELTPRMIHHSYKGHSGKIDTVTRAYEIRCESLNKNRLIVLLTRISNKYRSGTFILHSMAKSDPAGYSDHIRNHNRFLDSLKMITVYGLRRQVMENPTNDSDNPTFRGHLLDFQDCFRADGGSVTYQPMLLGIESTQQTDSLGKWMFLCTKESAPRVTVWIDTQLPSQYQTATLHDLNDTPTDMNTGITEETAFPAPSRSNFHKQASIVEKYEADLRASLPTTTPDSQEDPALFGGYTYPRNRTTKTRKTKASKLSSLRPPGRQGTPAQAPGDKNTYCARTAASIPSTSSPSEKQAKGKIHRTGGKPIILQTDYDRLGSRLEESDHKIAALVTAAKHQDDTIETMHALHNKTQATVDQLTVQISELVALISRDGKPANEEVSHILTTTSTNKRSSTDSPPASPSSTNNRPSKKLNDSLTPIKRILQDAFGYSDGTSAIVDASQNKPD